MGTIRLQCPAIGRMPAYVCTLVFVYYFLCSLGVSSHLPGYASWSERPQGPVVAAVLLLVGVILSLVRSAFLCVTPTGLHIRRFGISRVISWSSVTRFALKSSPGKAKYEVEFGGRCLRGSLEVIDAHVQCAQARVLATRYAPHILVE